MPFTIAFWAPRVARRVNSYLPKLADYIVEHVDWITQAWVDAIKRQPDIQTSDDLSYGQLVDHLPALCRDLAARLRNVASGGSAAELQHAQKHGEHRWQQGYRVDELIRESGILRHVFAVECLDAFARTLPAFDLNARTETATIVHRFFDDVLIQSAQRFAAEKAAAISASERNIQAILESALDSIIVFGEDGRIREFNSAAERTFGYKRAEAIGQDFTTLIIPPELREQHRRAFAAYVASGDSELIGRRMEIPAPRAGGGHINVESVITAHRTGDQAVFTAYLRDLTERTRGEEAGRRLSALVESSDDAIISKDLNGTITSWNRGARALFGYTAEEVIGQPITMLIPPDRQEEEPRIMERIRRGERLAPFETLRRRKDGTVFNISVTVSPIKDNAGNVIGASKIARDISERVQHERRREAQYAIANLTSTESSLTETATRILATIGRSGPWLFGALWLRDAEGNLKCETTWQAPDADVEEYARATMHRTFESVAMPTQVLATGKPVWLSDVRTEPRFVRRDAAAASGLHGALVFPLSGATGANGVIEMLSGARISPDADLLRLVEALGIQVGLYIERKHTEEELHRQKNAAEAANLAKDRFLAALSHELRTPLTPVLMWACATAGDERLDPELREEIRMVCRNIELEARLIDDLLDLTRVTQGKLQLKLQPCDANVLLEHAIDIVQSQFTGKNVKLALELTAANHQIRADATRMQQVFWNLLKNAQKFTPAEGLVTVRSFEPREGVLAFEISDTGRGIDAELMPRLFTAFEQGASSTEGLGLGLAISKAIVEMHGGKIFAASEGAGRGATFTVELSTVAGQIIGPPTAERSTNTPWRKLRILMVEDHEHTALVMSRLLRRAGHEVMTASTVEEAFRTLKTAQIDLLVSDLGLPDGNGFQVMRELARRSEAKGIAVSGYGLDEDIAESSAAGFSAHLVKPVSPEQLETAIKQVTQT